MLLVEHNDHSTHVVDAPVQQTFPDQLFRGTRHAEAFVKLPANKMHGLLVREDIPDTVTGDDKELVLWLYRVEHDIGGTDQRPILKFVGFV